MNKIYIIVLLLFIILLINNGTISIESIKSKITSENDFPLVNKEIISENEMKEKEDKGIIYNFFNNLFSIIRKYIPEDIVPTTYKSKVNIINEPNVFVDKSNWNIKTDIVSPNPIGNTEYRFFDEDPNKPYSEINVSQHPSYYKSTFQNELTKTGDFFDENQMFNDKTSPYSKTILPDRCFLDNNNNVLCNYNDKLQIIPPKLISEPNNKVIQSIGQGKGDIFKTIEGKNVELINGGFYQSWKYDDEKLINGGGFFNGIKASDPDSNENYLLLENIENKPNYVL